MYIHVHVHICDIDYLKIDSTLKLFSKNAEKIVFFSPQINFKEKKYYLPMLLSILLSKDSFKLILIDSELILILGDTHGFSP